MQTVSRWMLSIPCEGCGDGDDEEDWVVTKSFFNGETIPPTFPFSIACVECGRVLAYRGRNTAPFAARFTRQEGLICKCNAHEVELIPLDTQEMVD